MRAIISANTNVYQMLDEQAKKTKTQDKYQIIKMSLPFLYSKVEYMWTTA
jgi:hypothetical protein